MTRYVVDASAVLELASSGIAVPDAHQLLAPTLLRSQVPSTLHEAVQRDEIPADLARERLAWIGKLPIRLLGDGVLRRRAWEIADQLGWASTYDAEYVALTQLQADALITLDAEFARRVEGIVATASIDGLFREGAKHARAAARSVARGTEPRPERATDPQPEPRTAHGYNRANLPARPACTTRSAALKEPQPR